MSAAERIAISLPRELLKSVERLRRETGETRSALVQRALREVVAQKKRAEQVHRYVEGYAASPETAEEIAAAEAAATHLLAEEPWE
jgi:metal-responsive CopG/Arc/MetJ family transcriptional regulator